MRLDTSTTRLKRRADQYYSAIPNILQYLVYTCGVVIKSRFQISPSNYSTHYIV